MTGPATALLLLPGCLLLSEPPPLLDAGSDGDSELVPVHIANTAFDVFALDTEGSLWSVSEGLATPLHSGDSFIDLDGATNEWCGVYTDNGVICDGREGPTGQWERAAAGDSGAACAWNASGSIRCWGSSTGELDHPPSGPWRDVDLGASVACGIGSDEHLRCWGNEHDDILEAVPTGTFIDVAVSNAACALTTGGQIVCWGDCLYGMEEGPASTTGFVELKAGDGHACGLRENGAVDCWGHNRDLQAEGNPGPFVAFSVGGWTTCGLREDGSITCWGFTDLEWP